MHIKRKTIEKFWPVPKTGTKYLAVPTHEKRNSVPLIIFMKEVLKSVKTKKELKKLLHEKKIIVNSRIIKETNYPLSLFDYLSIPSVKKYYKVILNKGKFDLKEINEKEASQRIYKVIGKKMLTGKKIQLNLSNGKNILPKDNSNEIVTGDFVILNNESGKILKIIKLAKDSEILVINGKYLGIEGKIKEIITEGENKMAILKSKEKSEDIKVNLENLFAKE